MTGGPNRRELLEGIAALGGVAATTATAGCVSSLTGSGGGGGGPGSSTVKKLPAETDGLFWMDIEAFLDDEAVKRIVNAAIERQKDEPYYSGPESYQEALDLWNATTDLDTEAVESMVAFAENSTIEEETVEEFGGVILKAGWSAEEFVSTIEQSGTDYQKTRIGGKDVYEPEVQEDTEDDDSPIAVLESDTYAFAENKDHLRTIIEAWTGEGDRIDGELTAAFQDTRAALVRSVWRFPSDQIPETAGDSTQIDLSKLKKIEVVTFSLYRDGDNRGIEMGVQAGDEEAAKDVAKVFKGVIPVLQSYPGVDREARSRLDKIEVSRDGTEVSVTYEASIENWVEVGVMAPAVVGTFLLGIGQSQQVVPSASFDFDYDSDEGTVTIVHEGGDTFTAENTAELRYGVRGRTSTWELPVRAGDSVRVEDVSGGETITVVWEAPDGDQSQVVADYDVPGSGGTQQSIGA